MKDSIKTADGWTGSMEDLCAPADEVDQFDRRVTPRAGSYRSLFIDHQKVNFIAN